VAAQELGGPVAPAVGTGGDGAARGFPVAGSAFAKAPFDVLGDTLRGTTGIMKDMFRCPDKLLKAMADKRQMVMSGQVYR